MASILVPNRESFVHIGDGVSTSVHFGPWLDRQLARQEWSPAEFARRLGVGNSTVTMWLRGERVPNPDSCRKIADALFLPRREVLIAAGHDDPDLDVDPDSPPERFRAMMQRIRWDPQREQLVEAMLRQMIEFDRDQDGE